MKHFIHQHTESNTILTAPRTVSCPCLYWSSHEVLHGRVDLQQRLLHPCQAFCHVLQKIKKHCAYVDNVDIKHTYSRPDYIIRLQQFLSGGCNLLTADLGFDRFWFDMTFGVWGENRKKGRLMTHSLTLISLLLPPVAHSVLNSPNLFIFICRIVILGTWLTPPQKALLPLFLQWKNKCRQTSIIHKPDFIKVLLGES